ncbi:MAG: dihydroxy-acid dehydratase [Candidatus Eremiobacteraeota bacterium]|nr:dihydroxy-acid dehydratase [Candidatus Eremiobacteraeota bacterium]
MTPASTPSRSKRWFAHADGKPAWPHRVFMNKEGFPPDEFDGRPIVGICNSWSELTPCNLHLRRLAESVKRGVFEAGGLPVEFPTMSLGETLMRPTTMFYRNLMSMDVEESIRGNPIDGVVLLAGCDKTTPAQLMGAASVDLPAIMVTGGPMLNVTFRGEIVGSGTDLWRFQDEVKAGRMSPAEWDELELAFARSTGHCNTMGTASTMASVAEALGMTLAGNAAIPAVDSRRYALAQRSGRRIVELIREGVRPSHVMTRQAFENAIRVNVAIGGSTNAVVHLLALAGRVGVPLDLEDFDRIGRDVPLLVNLKPSGAYLMEEFFAAGGVPAVVRELGDLLHDGPATVSGVSLVAGSAEAACWNREVIRERAQPLLAEGAGIAVLRGNLAPNGAVIKPSAATPALMRHHGRAVVFEDIDDYLARIDDPALDVDADCVLVLKGAGPQGYPGMPEVGNFPLPRKLIAAGVKDMVRISDARMSGTAYGTVVLHVAPESAAGGPLAFVRDGDAIELDVPERRLELGVGDAELRSRAATRAAITRNGTSGGGYTELYRRHVMQADRGADFDFLVGCRGEAPVR